MVGRVKHRVGRNGLVYLPVKVRRQLGIEEGGKLIVVVEDDKLILLPEKSVFKLGAESRKISEISVEEFERESEAMQVERYG